MKIRKKNGFTLIELLVVATIIVVLSAIGLVSFTNAGKSARNSKRKSDLETVRQALVLYKSDTGSYPIATIESYSNVAGVVIESVIAKAVQALKVQVAFAVALPTPPPPSTGSNAAYNEMIVTLSSGYISSPTPVDPKSGANSCGLSGSSPCDYKYTGNVTTFTLSAPLEGDVDYVLSNP